MIDFDDKDLGIAALGIIAVVALIMLGHDGISVAATCIGGISGMVTGKRLGKEK